MVTTPKAENGGGMSSKADYDKAKAELSGEIETLKGDISKLSDAVSRLASSGVNAASDEANSRARALSRSGKDVAARASDEFDVKTRQLADYARQRPFAALAAAAGAGLLIGLLTAKRK